MKEKIRLYGLSTCHNCKQLRSLLIDRDVKFDWDYVDMLIGEERNAALQAVKQINPAMSFPTLVIGDTVIVGFKKDEVLKALDEYRRSETAE